MNSASSDWPVFTQVAVPAADSGSHATVEGVDAADSLENAVALSILKEWEEWCLIQNTAVGDAPLWATCPDGMGQTTVWRLALHVFLKHGMQLRNGQGPMQLLERGGSIFASVRLLDGIELLSACSHAGGGLRVLHRALSTLVSLHHTLGDVVWRRDVVPRLVAAGHARTTSAVLGTLLQPWRLRINGTTVNGRRDIGDGVSSGKGDCRQDWSDARAHILMLVEFLTLGGETLLAARFSEHCSRGEIMHTVVGYIVSAIRYDRRFWATAAAAAPQQQPAGAAAAVGGGRLTEGTSALDSPGAFMSTILGLVERVVPRDLSAIQAAAALDDDGDSRGVTALLALIDALTGDRETGVEVGEDLWLNAIRISLAHIMSSLLMTDPPPSNLHMVKARRTALHLACHWHVSGCRADVAESLAALRSEACVAVDLLQRRLGPAGVYRCLRAAPLLETLAVKAACRGLVRASGGAVEHDPDDSGADGALPIDAALLLFFQLLGGDGMRITEDVESAVAMGVAGAVAMVRWIGQDRADSERSIFSTALRREDPRLAARPLLLSLAVPYPPAPAHRCSSDLRRMSVRPPSTARRCQQSSGCGTGMTARSRTGSVSLAPWPAP